MLTGRQKIEAAFSREGSREFAATPEECRRLGIQSTHNFTGNPAGNLDAIGILQNGSDTQLRVAIAEQIAAGRRNQNRFVVCLGSPVTPATPVDRVRLYCDLVREMSHDR